MQLCGGKSDYLLGFKSKDTTKLELEYGDLLVMACLVVNDETEIHR